MAEAAVAAVRVQTRLPLGDLFAVMRDAIPHPSRSSLNGALQRHGVSRLPKAPVDKPKRFKAYEIGYLHVDIAELRCAEGKALPFAAVDRTSKLVFARVYRTAGKVTARGFLMSLRRSVPYRVHTVLTDNGVQFVDRYEAGGATPSTASAGLAAPTASSTGSPSPTTRGPTDKRSGRCAPSRAPPSTPSTTRPWPSSGATSGTG